MKKYLKYCLSALVLILCGSAYAQEAVIEDVSFLVQYIKGDTEGTRYSVALSKSSRSGKPKTKRDVLL